MVASRKEVSIELGGRRYGRTGATMLILKRGKGKPAPLDGPYASEVKALVLRSMGVDPCEAGVLSKRNMCVYMGHLCSL